MQSTPFSFGIAKFSQKIFLIFELSSTFTEEVSWSATESLGLANRHLSGQVKPAKSLQTQYTKEPYERPLDSKTADSSENSIESKRRTRSPTESRWMTLKRTALFGGFDLGTSLTNRHSYLRFFDIRYFQNGDSWSERSTRKGGDLRPRRASAHKINLQWRKSEQLEMSIHKTSTKIYIQRGSNRVDV